MSVMKLFTKYSDDERTDYMYEVTGELLEFEDLLQKVRTAYPTINKSEAERRVLDFWHALDTMYGNTEKAEQDYLFNFNDIFDLYLTWYNEREARLKAFLSPVLPPCTNN